MVFVASVTPRRQGSQLAQKLEPLISDDELQTCWNRLDTENNGFLTFSQFCIAMEELGFQWSIDDAKSVFKMIDTDKNKQLSYEEFRESVNVDLPAMSEFWTFLVNPEKKEEEEEEFNLTLDEMVDILKNRDGDWKMRVKSMQQLTGIVRSMSDEDFSALMRDLSPCFQSQLEDRRSVVVREACLSLVSIGKAHTHSMSPFVRELFPSLFVCVRMNVQAISKPGMMACANLVRHSVEDHEYNVLHACIEGLDEPHVSVREVCQTYLSTILEVNDLTHQSDEFWGLMFAGLTKGISDQNASARTECYNAIKQLRDLNVAKYEEFFATLVKGDQKRVERALGIKKKRKRMKRPKKHKKKVEEKVEEKPESPKKQAEEVHEKAETTKETSTQELEHIEELKDPEIIIDPSLDPSLTFLDSKTEENDVQTMDIGGRRQSQIPMVGEIHVFLNAFGYKQKAVVRGRDGDLLTIEWLPNDRRYSHTGVSTRQVDDPHYDEITLVDVSSGRSEESTDEVASGCAICVIS